MQCGNKLNWIKIAFILILFLAIDVKGYDLNGIWQANSGGGYYYIRQEGNQVWWLGEQRDSNPDWCNVAYGEFSGSTNSLTLNWADIPKGIIRNHGILILNIATNDRMDITNKDTGGFGANRFTRIS